MKYRFEITYQTKYMIEASRLLKCLDVGMDEIGFQETMIFTSQKDLIIKDLKELINQAYESSDRKILKIEGGKVE